MKTTPPTACQGIPGTEGAKRVLVRYRDMTRVDPCPYGQACRIVTGGEGGVANVHVITVKRTYKIPCEQAIATAADLLQQHIKGTSLES